MDGGGDAAEGGEGERTNGVVGEGVLVMFCGFWRLLIAAST